MGGSISSTPFEFTYTPKNKDNGKKVTITVTTNNPQGSPCTAAKATFVLTIGSVISAPVIGTVTGTTCINQTGSVVLNGLPSGGPWVITANPGGLTTSGTGTSTTISGLEAGIHTFTVTNALGCISASSANVTINQSSSTPATPTVGTISPPTCQSSTGSVVLNGLPSSGTWTLTRYPGTVISAGTGISTTISGLPSGTYNFSITNSTGCTSNLSANVIIPVQTNGVNMIVTNPAGVCSPMTVDLTATVITAGSDAGLTFTYWTNAEATIAYATPSTAAAGTYYIKGILGSDCFEIKPVTVTISSMADANAGTGGHVCGLDFAFSAIITNGTGTWAKISGPGNMIFTPDNHHPDTHVIVDQFGTYDFAWNINNNSCTSTDIVRVIFHEMPSIDAGKGNDTTICEGTDIQLHASGAGFFSWAPPALFNNPNISDPVATPVSSTTLTVSLTDQFGCESSADIKVNVRNIPLANAGPDQLLESQFSTIMDAVLYNVDETGVWSLISGTGEFNDITNIKASVNGLSPEKNKFLWTVNNGVCPASYDTVMIVIRDLIIPTLITPNMDGRNDYFVIGGFSAQGQMDLVIFDRRGVQVYKNENYDNSWNGIDYNKNPLQEDTYYYILKTNNDQSVNGYIVIRR
jgi:gliding motility-associated-like protein